VARAQLKTHLTSRYRTASLAYRKTYFYSSDKKVLFWTTQCDRYWRWICDLTFFSFTVQLVQLVQDNLIIYFFFYVHLFLFISHLIYLFISDIE